MGGLSFKKEAREASRKAKQQRKQQKRDERKQAAKGITGTPAQPNDLALQRQEGAMIGENLKSQPVHRAARGITA